MPDRSVSDRKLKLEIWIVLGLSLGASAVYAVVSLTAKLTQPGGLRDSTASLNGNQDTREWLDLTYQLLGIGFAIVPVALALYLMTLDNDQPPVRERLGLHKGSIWDNVMWGALLAAVIGLPGIGVYFAGRALGVTAEIVTSPLDTYWWTVPVLILAAVKNAVIEEFIVVGYLTTRLRQLDWAWPRTIVASALLRGSYHLYQGFGQAFGNFVMGLVFGYWFRRTRRVLPLVIAHTILDVISFVGYGFLRDHVGWL
ncbi:CPBP family intramembrane glutamic endopeptidase [Aeromicrobium sp. Root236]|uniref:CPBP family intramembrane glutamic endopeptidase n=1 Tax=Aeromicrobium sp. Root236 TaxID=1736498 RepID=UPI000B2B2F9B|nr:CPBP family intramembrane glutamic endopeptidase [Aeromicrobium sp. Root236]